MLYKIAFGLVCLVCSSALMAGLPETPQFQQLGVPDGLPSSTINHITQDHDGYLWFASKDGLARYDGIDFKVFRYEPEDENSLPGNTVQLLHVDGDNQLWIGVEGQGLLCLNAKRNQFKAFRKAAHPSMGGDDVWAINSDKDGNIWFGVFAGGLHRLDRNGVISRIVLSDIDEQGLPTDIVLSIAIDQRNHVWVGTTNGLFRWDGEQAHRIADEILPNSFVLHLAVNLDGSIWAGTRQGAQLISPEGNKINEPLLSGKSISGMFLGQANQIWLTSDTKVYHWQDGVMRNYPVDSDVAFTGLYLDSNDSIWLSTQDLGTLRLASNWRDFSVYKNKKDDKGSLSGNYVRSAFEFDKKIWLVSLHGGLDRLDLSSNVVDRVLSTAQGGFGTVWSVRQIDKQNVWIGHTSGLTEYNLESGKLRHWKKNNDKNHVLPGSVNLITQTPDGLIWTSSYGGGIQARTPDGNVVHTILADQASAFTSPDPDQFSISPDGELWVATSTGLIRWDKARQAFAAIPGSPKKRIDAFTFVGKDRVWLHHIGAIQGMNWDGKSLREIHRIGTDAGLPAVEVGALLADKKGDLWLSTMRGLLHYRVKTKEIKTYGVRDGLPSQEFDMQPGLVTNEGFLVLGTKEGLVVFDPNLVGRNTKQANLVLDMFDVRRDEDVIPLELKNQSIELEASDRDLRVRTRLLAFDDARSHRYRFYLKGLDTDWVDVSAQGERIFSTLAPGDYVLQVKAAHVNHQWTKPMEIFIKVHPPWWETWWAYVLWCALMIMVLQLTALWYRRRLKQRHAFRLIEQERHLERQNSKAKSEFLATLGHEIRTPMTGVLGMTELLQASRLDHEQKHRVQSIHKAGQHLLRLVNDALDLARIEAGKLALEMAEFSVNELIEEVVDILKPLALQKGLSFRYIKEDSMPDFCMGDPGRIRQILLNLVNNAIKFTESGEVMLRGYALSPQGITIEVNDTGPGISPEQQLRLFQRFEQAEGNKTAVRYGGSGLGLAICQELAVAMNGMIVASSELGQGASFVLSLPLQNSTGASIAIQKNKPEVRLLPKKLLLVEDDAMVAEVIQALLMADGHKVIHALQGLQALTLASTQHFDAALLDLDLPGINGFELAKMLERLQADLPMIAVTARADVQAEHQARDSGMQGFLRKPVSADSLIAVLHEVTEPK
jgi:signal transduction histidine kinase/CheY-like chemotaxis protein/streptogramin lyase